jgi:hypothetical protein
MRNIIYNFVLYLSRNVGYFVSNKVKRTCTLTDGSKMYKVLFGGCIRRDQLEELDVVGK